MHFQDFLGLKVGDILFHPNGGALMVVVDREFWMKKVGQKKVQDFQGREEASSSFVLFRYLGLNVEGNIGNPSSENATVQNYNFMHFAELVCTGVTAKNIYTVLDVLVNFGKNNLEFLREDLWGIIVKDDFWKEALKSS
ncbi:MAG: hypothetical protein WA055_05775 [Candidatus Moraniibacteriota bacterium]